MLRQQSNGNASSSMDPTAMSSTATVPMVPIENETVHATSATQTSLPLPQRQPGQGTPSLNNSATAGTPENASSPYSQRSLNHARPVVAHLQETVHGIGRETPGLPRNDAVPVDKSRMHESTGQHRYIDRLLADLSPATDDYLLTLFFDHGNYLVPVVGKEAFYRDKADGRLRWYNGFLHVCILAMGLRYADSSRSDVARLLLPSRDSTMHRGAIYLAEYQLQSHGGIPSVQAFLLLGDLEAACGRDDSGWMYGGTLSLQYIDPTVRLPSVSSHLQTVVAQEHGTDIL